MQSDNCLSLYIHIPFCRTRCTYCDFNIYTNLAYLFEPYTEALCLETERTLAAVAAGNYNPLLPLPPVTETALAGKPLEIKTVFIGGGTPSLLPPALIEKIMRSLTRFAVIRPGAEITLEANPGTLTLEQLGQLREIGINRLSYGVQTFDNARLKKLGRAHDIEEAIASFRLAREAGFDNISLDFIYGLPGETLENWRETLQMAVELRAEHLSLYGLIVEEDTWLGRAVARGKLTLPDDDTSADMYTLATNLLAESGYEQYEISNWARESTEKYGSTHNMVYWYNQPYIGLGVGAHSSFGGYRFAVLKHPKDYIKGMREGKSVILTEEAEPITPGLRLADTVFLALRMNEGLPLNRIEQEYGKTIFELFPGVVEKFLGLGLLEAGQNRAGEHVVRLTLRGRLLSNNVFLEFLPE